MLIVVAMHVVAMHLCSNLEIQTCLLWWPCMLMDGRLGGSEAVTLSQVQLSDLQLDWEPEDMCGLREDVPTGRASLMGQWSGCLPHRMGKVPFCPEQGIKLLGLLLTGSTGQHMASRNGLA